MKYSRKNVMKKMASVVLAAATVMSIMPVSMVMAEDQAVAIVDDLSTGRTKYYSIKSAWEAVKKDGGKIYLEKDWDTSSYGRLIVDEGIRVDIYMQGHTINRNLASTNESKSKRNGEVIYVSSGATLNIDGQYSIATSQTRVGHIESDGVWYSGTTGTKKDVTIEGSVIAGGYSANGGGGIHVKDKAQVTLKNVTLAGNKADEWYGDGYGGGIAIDGSNASVTLDNSKIMYNYAQTSGGGISADGGHDNITLNNGSEISNNKADKHGGGIYIDDDNSNVILNDSKMRSNIAGENGGGIYGADDYINVKMTGDSSEISNNTARNKGGGIYFNYSKVSVVGGKFESNHSMGGGGGAIYLQHFSYIWSTDSVTISNVTFNENYGNGDGGAIHSEQENAVFSGCTFTGNIATGKGGGIYVYNDDNTISNCTITGNRAKENGGGVFVDSMEDISLGGTVVINENILDSGKRSNLELGDGSASTCYITTAPGIGSKIGISVSGNEDRMVASFAYFTDKYFFADDESRYIAEDDDGSLFLKVGEKPDSTPVEVGPDASQTGGQIKGYFSYPSFPNTTEDVDGVFYYSDSYFNNDPGTYNKQLATMSICLAMSAFNSNTGNGAQGGTDYILKSKNIVKLLSDIGVERDNIYLSNTYTVKPGTGTIGVAIGQKPLSGNDGSILVPIAIRGAGYESEWTSNVTIGDGNSEKSEHAGFSDAAQQVFEQVKAYINDYDLTQAVTEGKVNFWVTGYSRAGATANLTARRLIDEYGEKNNKVFAYCMEAPQGALKQQNEAKYSIIHNCINYADPVPKVAPVYMDFTRYGVDYLFNDNTDKKSQAYKDAKAAMKRQLKMVSDDIAYTDYFKIGTINMVPTIIENAMANLNLSMIRPVSNATSDSPKDAGKFMDTFIDKFSDWAVKDRASFVTAPTGDHDLREAGSGLESVSFEKSLQLVMPILFTKSDAELEELMEVALDRANDLSLTGVYFGPILGKWDKITPETKKKWIWNELWYKVVETDENNGVASKLSAQELADLKTAWPTLLDTLFNFVSSDYNFESWALNFTVVGNQVVACPGDSGLNVLGTLALNADSLMQAHYPEINYAWLRSLDDNYNKETKAVNIVTDRQPSVGFSLDESSYNGDQTLKLTAGEDTKGEGIYYRLTTTVNGTSTTAGWLPYNKSIALPAVTDKDGKGTVAVYKVDVRAVYCDNEINESRTYTINPITLHNVIVRDSDTKNEILRISCDTGKKVTLTAPDQENKFFAGWDNKKDIIEDKDKTNKTITFTMPDEDVELTAKYKNLISKIEIKDLTDPTGGSEFDSKANVTFDQETASEKEYDVIWTSVDKDGKHEVVTSAKAGFNTTYEAILVLKPEEGKLQFAENIQAFVNGGEIAVSTEKIQKQIDGSIWIYCGIKETGNPKFISAEDVNITAKTGTKETALGLPQNILVETEEGQKLAIVKDAVWTCESGYNPEKSGEYVFKAEIDQQKSEIAPRDGEDKITVSAKVTLQEKPKAAIPTVDESSVLPGTYKGNQTVKLKTTTANAMIRYKVSKKANTADKWETVVEETQYNLENGIELAIPDNAKSGDTTQYKIIARTISPDAGQMDNSDEVEYNYTIVKPYTVKISCRDTGFNQGAEGAWTKDVTATYLPGEVVSIVASEEQDEQFEKWTDLSGITLTDAQKTSKLIKVDNIQNDINLTAVYNPVVSKINLTIPAPVTGEKLAKTVAGCNAKISAEYDVIKDFKQTIPIIWTPAGNDGTATAYQAYTAKMSMNMDSEKAKFYVSNQLQLSVKDADGNDIQNTWAVEKDKDGKDVLVAYATFSKTSKIKAKSVEQPSGVSVAHGATQNAIKEKLAKEVSVNLTDGTTIKAPVNWEDVVYDASVTTEQKVTASGTAKLPEYIDRSEIETGDPLAVRVTADVYIAAAPKPEKAKAPIASVRSGVYTQEVNVTLTSDTKDATIYYTLDGSEPNETSTPYDGSSIRINTDNKTTTLKAIAVKDGLDNSTVSTYEYEIYIHTHIDTNGDGKCDGIFKGQYDENGNRILEECDTVFLGRSTDVAGTTDSVLGTVAQNDGKGIIYVKVNAEDIVEKVDSGDSSTEDSKPELNWKYSNECYPTTKLQYAYKPEGSDASVATTPHGYIFAGWYKADGTMKAYDKMPEETAYAKFVDATVLSVKAQLKAGTTKDSPETNIRFLTSIDCLDYQEVGYDIKYGKKSINYVTDTVPKKIYENDGTTISEKTPKEVFENNISRNFVPLTITSVPKNAYDQIFEITAFYVTKEGTRVDGATVNKKVNDAEEMK